MVMVELGGYCNVTSNELSDKVYDPCAEPVFCPDQLVTVNNIEFPVIE